MLALKRLSAVVQRVTLGCAALLLIVVSVSSRQGAEVRSGLTVQTLCQAMGLRSPLVRRSANAPFRATAVRRLATDDRQTPAVELDNSELACFLTYRQFPSVPVRFIAVLRNATSDLSDPQYDLAVPRARGPPALETSSV